jgi:hypothetical protein
MSYQFTERQTEAIYKLKLIKILQFQDTKWLELCNPTTGQANIAEQPPRAGGCGFKSHPFLHSKVPAFSAQLYVHLIVFDEKLYHFHLEWYAFEKKLDCRKFFELTALR